MLERFARPVRQLAGFARVSTLPGTTIRAHVDVGWRTLAYFDEARDCFVVEPGETRVLVARHAQAPPSAETVLSLQERMLPG